MTVSALASYTSYIGDGAQTTFAYPFLVLDAAHLQVYVGGGLTTAYSVTGIGVPTGGNVILYSPAPAQALVQIYRTLPLDQPTAYTRNDPFPAAAHEAALDRLALQVQQLKEELERKVGFLATVQATLRNLAVPLPGALKLLGWNAQGTGLTLFDAAQIQITPDPVAGLAYGKTTTTVNSSAGANNLTAVALIPAGVKVLGVTYRCTVTFSNENGLTSLDIGGMGLASGWGAALGILAGITSSAGTHRGDEPNAVSAENVTLVPNGGLFGATGQCKLTAHWRTLTPDI